MSYIIRYGIEKDALIVDPGDSDQLIEYLHENNLLIKGVLLTHGHFDHIYGINDLLESGLECPIYTNIYGAEMLKNAKLNMSKYHECPYVVNDRSEIVIVQNNQELELLKNTVVKVFFTPGHNPSCITWVIENAIFTGDSFIPDVKVVTNLPGGNKELAKESIDKIKILSIGKSIYPGHAVINK